MEIPYIPKERGTIVATEAAEANAIRAVLEYIGYRIDTILVGSRAEFMKILSGEVLTESIIILVVHGIKEGIHMENENPITPSDITAIAKLADKLIVNLGCDTGRDEYRKAFANSGVKNYIAPNGYPDGNSALMFVIRLFYELKKGTSVIDATTEAASLDKETAMFQ